MLFPTCISEAFEYVLIVCSLRQSRIQAHCTIFRKTTKAGAAYEL